METIMLPDSWVFTWVILPLLIFMARILDVSIGTLRLIFVSKGFKFYAPLLGFFEVVIWLLAIGQIMQHLDNFMCYLAYGLGFAAGNYIRIFLDEKMSLGTVLIRVVPRMDTTNLINHLREHNPHAFVTIEDVKTAREGYFRYSRKKSLTPLALYQDFRKGK